MKDLMLPAISYLLCPYIHSWTKLNTVNGAGCVLVNTVTSGPVGGPEILSSSYPHCVHGRSSFASNPG